MAFTTPDKSGANLNVTPLIDVLLVLLIIFMVISPGKSVGLDALIPQPPQDRPRQLPLDPTVVVSIGKNREITINSESSDLDHLGQRLLDIYKTRSEKVLFVKAHPDTEYQHVVRVIDISKSAYVEKVGLLGGGN